MNTFNINKHDFLDNEQEELKKSTNTENNDDFKKRFTKDFNNQMNNFQNTDLIGLKYFPEKKDQNIIENAPNENNQKYVNDNDNKKKDISYYNKIINTLNKELGIASDKLNNKNNINIPRNSSNNLNNKKYNNKNDNKKKNKNHNTNKKEIMKENNSNKLTDLENNKIFLLNKNKEIEEQINNLQNLAKKVNLINEKNNYYINNNNVNMNTDAYKEDNQQYNNDFSNKIFMNDQINYIIDNNNSYKIPENYSNILQDKNNYIQIEYDSIEPFFEEKKNNYNNFENYNEGIKNYSNFKFQEKKKNDNLEQLHPYYENYENNISSTSRNNKYNVLKKNRTFNQRKTHDNYRPKNIKLKSKKRKDSSCISSTGGGVINNEDSKKIIKRINSYKNGISSSSKEKRNKSKKKLRKSVNKKMINEFKNDSEDLENKCNYLKNIIGEMNRENFDNKTKLFLIDKINELQIDFINKISSLEKKYKTQNDNNKKKINKLEKENNDLRKKVIKIKSIV